MIEVSTIEGDSSTSAALESHGVLSAMDLLSISTNYCVGVLGVLGNSLTLVILLHSRMLNKFHNILILNQACADLYASAIILLVQVIPVNTSSLPNNAWGEFVCRFWLNRHFLWMSLQTSTNNLVLITLERYLAVVHPITHRTRLTKRKLLVAICVVWLHGSTFPLPSQSGHYFSAGVCIPFLYNTRAFLIFYGSYLTIGEYFIPVPIFIFAYTRMYLSLRTSKVTSGKDDKESATNKASRNLFKTLILVVVVFVVCWTWTQISLMGFCFGFDTDMTTVRYNVSVALSLLNCCINPLIYMANWKKFQAGLKRLCPCHAGSMAQVAPITHPKPQSTTKSTSEGPI